MDEITIGGLVRVAGAGPALDGIVFDKPSRTKVVVAVVDPARGPGFRTVHPRTLTERAAEGTDDHQLWRLIRRTPPPSHDTAGSGTGPGRGSRGHTRRAMHRTTGK